MKRLALLFAAIVAPALAAADLKADITGGQSTGHVVTFSSTTPGMPGSPAETRYFGSVSVETTDNDAMLFTVCLKIELADGSYFVVRQSVERTGAYTLITFPISGVPVGIAGFSVARHHQQQIDVMVPYTETH